MNKNKLQYWMYAILNKEFGKEVRLHRDSLHSRYEANRHSFEISTNTLSINAVKKYFIAKLLESGYQNSEKEPDYYCKDLDDKNYCVTLHQQSRGLDYVNSDRPVIIVNIYSHSINR